MSKIIGVTVGTSLPKPNFKQTDPTKGDYIKNKPDFDGLKDQVHTVSDLVGDKSVSLQIEDAVSQKSQVQIVTTDGTEILPTLNIHKLTQEEYDQALANGTLDENALYLTPDEDIDLSVYVTKDELSTKADASHNHDDVYYTEDEVDERIANHNHDSSYDALGAANTALETAKSYTDTEIAEWVGDETVSAQIENAIAEINSPVDSVNGQTGAVVLTASDVGALPSTTVIPSIEGLATETYVTNAVSQKSQVQIITWEADD